jgi:hypothetical protein
VLLKQLLGANPHKILTRLIVANIVWDLLAAAIWTALPATQWSIYQLGFVIASVEAIVASALFSLTLYGLKKKKNWAPVLAIVVTVAQRVFATYVFFPSPAIALTLIWSLVIFFFAYKTMKTPKEQQ